jgi:WD40 repeat protein
MSKRYSSFDEYGFRHFPRHLARNEHFEKLRELLLDFEWLQAKLGATAPQPLIDDYDLIPRPVGELTSEYESLRLIHEALQLSAVALAYEKRQLPSQLTGRLLGFKKSELLGLLAQIRKEVKHPWLRPLTPCLTSPGGPERFTLAGHSSWMTTVAITADGRLAVSGSMDSTLKVWDLENGIERFTLKGHSEDINTVAITPDGRVALSGSRDATLKAWDLENGIELYTLKGRHGPISAVAISPDGRKAVSGSYGILRVWDLESRTEQFSNNRFVRTVKAAAITSDGRKAIVVLEDNILIWDLENGNERYYATTLRFNNDMNEAAICPDRGLVALTASGGTLRVLDLQREPEIIYEFKHSSRLNAVAITLDGRFVVAGAEDMALKVWDLTKKVGVFSLSGHSNTITAVAISSASQRVVSGGEEETFKVWDLRNKVKNDFYGDHSTRFADLAVTTDGRLIDTNAVMGRALEPRESKDVIELVAKHDLVCRCVKDITISPDSRWVVSVSKGIIILRSIAGNSRKISFKGQEPLAFSPDGRLMAFSVGDNTIEVWAFEKQNWIKRFTLQEHFAKVDGVKISSNGRLAMLVGWEDIAVWDLESGVQCYSLKGGAPAAFSHDGRITIFTSSDNRLDRTILNIRKCERWGRVKHFTLAGHQLQVLRVAISPDERLAVSISWAGPLKVWDLRNGTEIFTLIGHSPRGRTIAISPDSRVAVSTSEDKTLKFWDLDHGTCILTYVADTELQRLVFTLSPFGIIASDKLSRWHFLALEPESSAQEGVAPFGPFIVTALQVKRPPRWQFWRKRLFVFGCPYCHTWSEISKVALGTEIPCPSCAKHIKLNSFSSEGDWRSTAEAWSLAKTLG